MSDLTKFTKGIWVADYDGSMTRYTEGSIYCGDFHLAIITGSNYQCTFGGTTREYGENHEIEDDAEHKANANLIAAAPEMYKMLDDLANGRGVDYPIEQLLAKARGE
jgi:hypothetical protein